MSLEKDPEYPVIRQVADLRFTLTYMSSRDAERVLGFARDLPPHDLLFLRRDITDLDVVEDWLRDIECGEALTILAWMDEVVVGYGTIHRHEPSWSAHVAELRVVVAASARGKGLGRILTQEAFKSALRCGIEKMMARLTVDQEAAIAVFEGLGFHREALLEGHVKDLDGNPHDLVLMSRRVEDFSETVPDVGLSEVHPS
ncbi:MAG: GNAT family N-acetyltransferase [Acidobacteriota bacterium]|nr:GNAT family N-acetyltransferase [Acidobacteriota bacterium]